MKLTGFIVSLNVAEEPTEAGCLARIPLCPADTGANILGGMVGADLIILPLRKKKEKKSVQNLTNNQKQTKKIITKRQT